MPMQRYEYRVIPGGPHILSTDLINGQAESGWRLVAVTVGAAGAYGYFERPIDKGEQ